MTLEEASLMEPLGVAVYAATQRGQVRAMENVIVSSSRTREIDQVRVSLIHLPCFCF